jgi:SRSO17 transposase
LRQLETLLAEGAPKYCVLADAGYGVDQAFRSQLIDMGLPYVVGIKSSVVVWPPGVESLPPKRYSGMGRPAVVPRRTHARQPVSVKDLAQALPAAGFGTISWRQGTNEVLSGRFAAVRVRHAGEDIGKAALHPLEWLLIEWPAGDEEPLKYDLSTLPEDIAVNDLVAQAHMRWRIERDYQDLKQALGLGHYEGRGWRGSHHHATLRIAAYGFLVSERTSASKPAGAKKNFAVSQVPTLPADYIPRGSPARTAPRVRLDHHDPLPTRLSSGRSSRPMSLLRASQRKAPLVTQKD